MTSSPARKYGILIGEAVIVVGLLAYWLTSRQGAELTEVRWLAGHDGAAVEAFATLEKESPLVLELSLPSAAHVYVASFEPVRGTIAMFPSTWLRSDLPANPMPAGVHRFPGTHDGVDLLWHAGDVPGPISFMVVVSERPLPELEATMKTLRQFGNAAFPKRQLTGCYAPEGGMAVVPELTIVHGEELRSAFDLIDTEGSGPMRPHPARTGVWFKVLRLQVEADETPDGDILQQFNQRLGEEFETLDPDKSPPFTPK